MLHKQVNPIANIWHHIFSGSLYIKEYLDLNSNKLTHSNHFDITYSRFGQLKKVLKCDDNGLINLLAKLGITEKILKGNLNNKYSIVKKNNPQWMKIIMDIIELAPHLSWRSSMRNNDGYPTYFLEGEELPFEALYIPFIEVSKKLLETKCGRKIKSLNEKAYAKICRQLLDQLFYISWRVLFLEFHISRSYYFNYQPPQNGITFINKFESTLLSNGFKQLFLEYPVLAKLTGITINNWVEAQAEFITRVKIDIPLLVDSQKALNEIIDIDCGVADRHNNGRSTTIITLSTGQKWVYKPREVKSELIFSKIIRWLENKNRNLSLPYPRVITKENYGWVEFVDGPPLLLNNDLREAYYYKSGILLCLIHILGCTDCHFENIVSHKEGPILVDAETILYPTPKCSPEVPTEEKITAAFLRESVLRSGILPRWEVSPDGVSVYDISGYGGYEEYETLQVVPTWSKLNTDQMEISRRRVKTNPRANVPINEEGPIPPHNFLNHIIEGFKDTAKILIEYKNDLLSDSSIIYPLQSLIIRYVFRDTGGYYDVFTEALAPEYLKNGVDFSIRLYSLYRTTLRKEFNHSFFPIISYELDMLQRGDIPYFTAHANDTKLTLKDKNYIEDCFIRSPFEEFKERISKLNQEHIGQQINIIKASFAARAANNDNAKVEINHKENLSNQNLNQKEILIIVEKLAKELLNKAFKTSDSGINWLGLTMKPEVRSWQLEPLETNLYDGTTGIALFFAALAKITDNLFWKELVDKSLFNLMSKEFNTNSTRIRIGGISGLGSEIYSLCKISEILKEEKYLEIAKRLAQTIKKEDIVTDTELDIVEGTAGLLLTLLELYKLIPQAWIINLAEMCGNRLCSTTIETNTNNIAWNTAGGKLLTGFSHGSSGIAYALLKLYSYTNNERYLFISNQALGYERSVFSNKENNWPDYREDKFKGEKQKYMTSWCHGAPGIGLSRLEAYKITNDDKLLTEAQIAAETTFKASFLSNSDVCCGNIGRIEFLISAGNILQRPIYIKEGIRQASLIAHNYNFGNPITQLGDIAVYNPSFFKGLAGIGYHLLRFFYGDKIPQVLLLS